jgi:hypothetical protein
MQLFFLVCWLLAVSVAIVPLVYFMCFGWPAREAEFIDKVRDGADGAARMDPYFKKFWSEGLRNYLAKRRAGTRTEPRARFRARYRALNGRSRYIVPGVLFLLVVGLLSGLVVETAIRTGYDQYVTYYTKEAQTESAAVTDKIVANAITVDRVKIGDLDAAFAPLPRIQLSLSALAAIAGAYLFMVAQLIQECRSRTLVYSDLFGASLRLLVAVPLGLSVSVLASESIGPFISFGLGAFPIAQLGVLIRRQTATALKAGDVRADDDQTVAMLGVTQSVSDVLAEENITCAQQLADIDPVILAVRTGLSFDYVLFLAAQSLVWCFLGKTASVLGPIGLGDVRAIWYLMQRPDAERKAVLDAVDGHFTAIATPQEPKAIDAVLLQQAFAKIAIDPYTDFLVHFTSELGGHARRTARVEPSPQLGPGDGMERAQAALAALAGTASTEERPPGNGSQ